jgi:hypothetical protein
MVTPCDRPGGACGENHSADQRVWRDAASEYLMYDAVRRLLESAGAIVTRSLVGNLSSLDMARLFGPVTC